jgi:hypothetical protein
MSMGADENNLPCCYFDKWDDKSYALIKVCYFKVNMKFVSLIKTRRYRASRYEKILLSKNMSMSSKYNDISYSENCTNGIHTSLTF